jgi:hypothetical protein
VLDENIISMYEVGEKLPHISASQFLCLENGTFFLDILTDQNWQKVYDYAQKAYDADKVQLTLNESAFVKHLRFERYLLSSRHAKADATGYIENISTK